MRLFIAVLLNTQIEHALRSAQDALHQNKVGGRYIEPQNLHLTLVFIGEAKKPDRVLEAMEQIRFKAFEITLSQYLGSFDNLLWAGTEKNTALETLVRQIRYILSEYGIAFDNKKFNPHFTLVRRADYRNPYKVSSIEVEAASMTVSRISLMYSKRTEKGRYYIEIGGVDAQPLS